MAFFSFIVISIINIFLSCYKSVPYNSPTTLRMLTSFFSKLSHVTLLMTFMSRPMEGRAAGCIFRAAVNLALRLLPRPFRSGVRKTVLFRCDTMLILDIFGDDLTVYTLIDDGRSCWVRMKRFSASVCSCWARWIISGNEATHSKRIAPPLVLVKQPYAAHVIGIVLDIELACRYYAGAIPGQAHRERRKPRKGISLYRDLDTAGGEQRRFIGCVPEHLHHIRNADRIGALVHAGIVHLNTGGCQWPGVSLSSTAHGRRHTVPSVPPMWEGVDVRVDEFQIRTACFSLCRNILPGETETFLQYLALEAVENVLNRLRFAIIRSCRAVDTADLREKRPSAAFFL